MRRNPDVVLQWQWQCHRSVWTTDTDCRRDTDDRNRPNARSMWRYARVGVLTSIYLNPSLQFLTNEMAPERFSRIIFSTVKDENRVGSIYLQRSTAPGHVLSDVVQPMQRLLVTHHTHPSSPSSSPKQDVQFRLRHISRQVHSDGICAWLSDGHGLSLGKGMHFPSHHIRSARSAHVRQSCARTEARTNQNNNINKMTDLMVTDSVISKSDWDCIEQQSDQVTSVFFPSAQNRLRALSKK